MEVWLTVEHLPSMCQVLDLNYSDRKKEREKERGEKKEGRRKKRQGRKEAGKMRWKGRQEETNGQTNSMDILPKRIYMYGK